MTLHTNQPFSHILFDRLLAKDIKERGDVDFKDAKHAFKRVAVVGMLFPTQPQFKGTGFPMPDELLNDDKAMVHQTLKSFSGAGIPTSPNVEFDVYNLLPPIASDFLQSANPLEGQSIEFPNVDLVIVNYVPDICGYTPMHREYYTEAGYDHLDSKSMSSPLGEMARRSVSRWNEMRWAWPQASFNVNAKFVATFYDCVRDEISAHHFERHEQAQVLLDNATEKRHVGIPHKMDVIANAETLRDFVPHVKKNSAIGAAIHKISQLKRA